MTLTEYKETKPDNVFKTSDAIAEEYLRARKKFAPLNSSHEGYAVLKEEVDEMWDAIKANDIEHAKVEAIQVAAMALAFIMEVDVVRKSDVGNK